MGAEYTVDYQSHQVSQVVLTERELAALADLNKTHQARTPHAQSAANAD
jgi:hypothetical protein